MLAPELGVQTLGDCKQRHDFGLKLSLRQQLSMLIFGGSNAAGAELANEVETFSSLAARALEQQYNLPRVDITNVAIGTTGADYWAHCCAAYLRQSVDLIFVETSFNDVEHEYGANVYRPNQPSVLTTLFSTIRLHAPDALIISANLIVTPSLAAKHINGYRRNCTSALDSIDGYTAALNQASVPILNIARAFVPCDTTRALWARRGHANALQHRALADVFIRWLTLSAEHCSGAVPAPQQLPLSSTLAGAWLRPSLSKFHPAMSAQLSCRTTINPLVAGALLLPLQEGESCASSPASRRAGNLRFMRDGNRTRVPGWRVDDSWHIADSSPGIEKGRVGKLRWVPTEKWAPLRISVEVGAGGLVGLAYFADPTQGSFHAKILRCPSQHEGKLVAYEKVMLTAHSSRRMTKTDLLYAHLDAGHYELRITSHSVPGVGLIGVSYA